MPDPDRYLETFVVPSWAEHLRQHERVTVDDQATEACAFAFQLPGVAPVAAHFIAARAVVGQTSVESPPAAPLGGAPEGPAGGPYATAPPTGVTDGDHCA